MQHRMTIRIPPEYKDWIQASAKNNHQTINGQIIEIFKRAIEREAQEKKENTELGK